MKKTLKITAVLCLVMAVAAVVFGIMALSGIKRTPYMGYSMFGIISGGGVMGFIGNLAIIGFTVVCYGLAGLNVLADRKKDALIWSAITSLLAIVSFFMAIADKNIDTTLGDVVVAAIPIVQTFLVIKSAE